MRTFGWIILTVTLFGVQGISQTSGELRASAHESVLTTNECFPKGGLGIIRPNLYVAVRSTKNELMLSRGNQWTGMSKRMPEVAIFFDGKIWPMQSLPEGFDLSKSAVISFEQDKVRFFDFNQMSGGYYRREVGQN